MEFAYEPYTKISVRSYLEYSGPEHLVLAITSATAPGIPAQVGLRWANGVLFAVAGFQPSDSLVKEYIAGHMLWDHVDFALMPEFKEAIAIPAKPLLTVSVVNLSSHPLFGQFANWIKTMIAGKSAK